MGGIKRGESLADGKMYNYFFICIYFSRRVFQPLNCWILFHLAMVGMV